MKVLTWFKSLFQPVRRCSVCKRKLHTAKDRDRGVGAGCYKRSQKAVS